MELRRFFVAPTDVADDGTITVRGGEAEHIARVLRMKKGFKAIVCTGDGSEITAEITDISRDSVTMRRLAERKADRRDAHLTLYLRYSQKQKSGFRCETRRRTGGGQDNSFLFFPHRRNVFQCRAWQQNRTRSGETMRFRFPFGGLRTVDFRSNDRTVRGVRRRLFLL